MSEILKKKVMTYRAKRKKLNEEFNRISEKKDEKSQSLMDNTMKLADMQRDIKVIEKILKQRRMILQIP